ncbi:DUF1870 family protein [Schaalia sp. ZJ405]|uniref:Aca2/YdiL-like domain-containing protein n=1 Tax=Schaalia sp. ZJ405 TaxID=2709403 RepID=UPI0013ED6D6F|nr:DUF1870 family protein [Schaalia sp. ZJ405]QPK81105.1 DUF1870 family protein [Schaalia sp. ZJ405]
MRSDLNISLTLRSYREALGLTQDEASRYVGVKQATWSRWEGGKSHPQDPNGVIDDLEDIMNFRDEILDELCEVVEHKSAVLGDPTVTLVTYPTDEAFHAANPRAREKNIPSAIHRSAAAICAHLASEDRGITVRLVE